MQQSGKRVLCAIVDEEVCDALTLLLRRGGYEVVCARSLITALLVSFGQTFDLYVLDAQFHGGAGAELCRSIRETDPLAPVILFSSSDEVSVRLAGLEAGPTTASFGLAF